MPSIRLSCVRYNKTNSNFIWLVHTLKINNWSCENEIMVGIKVSESWELINLTWTKFSLYIYQSSAKQFDKTPDYFVALAYSNILCCNTLHFSFCIVFGRVHIILITHKSHAEGVCTHTRLTRRAIISIRAALHLIVCGFD